MAVEVHKLSDGWDNTGGLQEIWNLDDAFEDLENADLRNDWHNNAAVSMNGDLEDVEQGNPWDELVIPRMDPGGLYYLNSLGPRVTYRTYNKVKGEWHTYNAVKGIVTPDPKQWDYDGWSDIVVPFRNLEQIA